MRTVARALGESDIEAVARDFGSLAPPSPEASVATPKVTRAAARGSTDGNALAREGYNRMHTIHGTDFSCPAAILSLSGFGRYLIPLMLGARMSPGHQSRAGQQRQRVRPHHGAAL